LKLQITYKDSFNAEFTEFIEIEMPLYSSSEAKKFGVSKSGSLVGLLFNLMVFVVLTAFWLFMVMECVRTPMMRYKKIIWVVLVIGGYVIGAALYYFMKKKKKSDK
ncbi:MAG: PLDc N-terminal domain-containing protein, partial [Candidatus Woesearchaeota archaeon]|nr:PLDc N-terminal domain-containing protein [Candidatus Woesearchaeota archaeon]